MLPDSFKFAFHRKLLRAELKDAVLSTDRGSIQSQRLRAAAGVSAGGILLTRELINIGFVDLIRFLRNFEEYKNNR